jgi:hypothetical protein
MLRESCGQLSDRSDQLWEAAITLAKRHGIQDGDLDNTTKLTILDEALMIANEKKQISLQRKLIIPSANGKSEINVWDVYGKIARGLLTFKEIGDVLVNIDPHHAAVPWAVVRTILMVSSH